MSRKLAPSSSASAVGELAVEAVVVDAAHAPAGALDPRAERRVVVLAADEEHGAARRRARPAQGRGERPARALDALARRLLADVEQRTELAVAEARPRSAAAAPGARAASATPSPPARAGARPASGSARPALLVERPRAWRSRRRRSSSSARFDAVGAASRGAGSGVASRRRLAPRPHEGLLAEVGGRLAVADDALQAAASAARAARGRWLRSGRSLGHVPVQTREGA